jgi:outer membrane protein assembly factor BamB
MQMMVSLARICLGILWMTLSVSGFGADWPCWRGPTHNGISTEADWSWKWGTNGPPVLWRAQVGRGFSSFAVADKRVFTLGNTNKTDTVFCFEAALGELLWHFSYPCDPQPLSYEGGPSATPTVYGAFVYTFSKEGDLFCLDKETGKAVWSRKYELWPQQQGDWPNTWHYAGSPLVLSGRLVLSVGQAGRALRPEDGTLLWESSAGHPGYSSPVPFRSANGEQLVFFSGHALFGVEAGSGRQTWKVPWKTLWDLNAADPLIHESRMFVSSGNGVGCALFDLATEPPRELWRNKNLKTLINSSVFWQGLVFGFNDTDLSCISWDTGEVKWTTRDVRKGSLVLAGSKLLLLSETGKLVVAEPTGRSYEPLTQAQILEGRCWTTPVLSGGRIFARNAEGDVVCLDVSNHKQSSP